MAVTVVVCESAEPGGADLTLTLDAPRIVLGRGEGCEVRLPDASVSHRHASLRQKGGEYVIVDEGSTNGTLLGSVSLPPQTPRVVTSGERVRLGRVWIEIRFEPALVRGSTASAAKELALTLVTRGLRAQGETCDAELACVEGPDRGTSLELREAGVEYVVGRSPDVAMRLLDPEIGRRHASILRKGDTVVVRDLGAGVIVEGAVVSEAVVRAGQSIQLGADRFLFSNPAATALAEIERSPDERVRPGDLPSPPARAEIAAADATSSSPAPPPTFEPTPSPPPAHLTRKNASGWSFADAAVILLALGVLVVSAAGGFFLLR